MRSELGEGGDLNVSALAALSDYAIFENCDDSEPALVKWLLDTRSHAKKGRDEGEAEAVIQASERRAQVVLTDDALGRTWASTHSLECHGTIWVCRELRRTGYLRELRPYFLRLIQRGRHQPVNEMNEFLGEFLEREISSDEYRRLRSGDDP